MSKESKEKEPETVNAAAIRMSGAIETALMSNRRFFYSQLTDEQICGFTVALSGYLEDLQHEWTRREILERSRMAS